LKPIAIATVLSIPDVASSTGYVAKASAYFFAERGFNYSDSRAPSNACSGPQPLVLTGTGPSQWLNPGSPVQFTLKGPGAAPRTVQLLQGTPDADPNTYTNVSEPTLYPGSDSSTITVPGAAGGFPAIEVSGKTVEDFTFDPVADSGAASGGLAIHWSPSTNSNSAMEIDLVYQTDAQATGLNAQVACTVVDDGDFSVPRSFLLQWERAGEDDDPLPREVRFTRYLTSVTTAGDASILLLNTLNKKQSK
jgi:hypothetical protein